MFCQKTSLASLFPKELPAEMLTSRKNLTRFTYETTAFEGWRLCISRSGTTFTKYFSDKNYGGPEPALIAAEKAKNDLIRLVDQSRRVEGKLSQTTITKGWKLLKSV